MYLEIFLADFAVFRVFWGISRDFAEIPEFRGSATARNIRSPEIMISWPDQFCFILSLLFLVGDMREIRIQPLLIRRSIDFPSPMSPSSPRTPNTPGFFEDLGSLDPSLYTMVAEVRLAGVLFEYLV